MKTSSFTSTSTHNRCPQRYWYRYQSRNDDAVDQEQVRKLGLLMSQQELLGHLAHDGMAKLVRLAVTEGLSDGDIRRIRENCLGAYEGVASESLAADAGELTGRIQLAETFNGHPLFCSVQDSLIHLDHYMSKGLECLMLLDLRPGQQSDVAIEIEDRMPTNRGAFRLRVDLVFRRGDAVWIVDWKTKETLTAQDRHQIRIYMEWARRRYSVGPSRIHGLMASLRTGNLDRVPFDVFSSVAFSEPEKEQVKIISKEPAEPTGTYPARPSKIVCRRCPYATICPSRV